MSDNEVFVIAISLKFQFLRFKLYGSLLEVYNLDNDIIQIFDLDIYNTYTEVTELKDLLSDFNSMQISNFCFINFKKKN